MLNLKGLATGIGSLPHKDADAALDLIFQYLPQIPFWPQLPKRDSREGMLAQFSENLPCLRVTPEGLYFEPKNQERELEDFYGQLIANNLDYFKISPDFALGLHKFYQRLEKTDLKGIEFIKCHVTGPFTFSAGINNDKNIALLNEPVFMQAIIKAIAMKALWQIEFFRKFGKKLIIFLDEPYLGCFGSAYAPINREDVVKGLSEVAKDIKAENVLLGVHCCGNTDWSILTDTPGIDIISFDAYGFLERLALYAGNLKSFFNRGGILCWGIAPTQDFTDKVTADLLVTKVKDGVNSLVKKGLSRDLLSERLLLSPACGLGTLEIEKAEEIFELLSHVSTAIKSW